MATPNRAAILTKIQKVLKKYYTPVKPPADRGLLDHLLYACCLENAPFEKADEAFAKLQELYFDWNEVRVTTVSELAEVMSALPEPRAAAANLKRALQAVFETHYSFDIETLKKQNIGKSVKQLEKYGGTPFIVAYMTQNALSGHAIAIDKGALDVLMLVGYITESEAEKFAVPGLERAIPKSKGVEFGSLIHQLGAEYFAAPHSPKVRKIILEIDADAKDRFPKRSVKKDEPAAEPESPAAPPTVETKTPSPKKTKEKEKEK